MGAMTTSSWQQRFKRLLERPLSDNRSHQPKLYNAVHVASLTGAYGWAALALGGTLGWAALPFYAVLAGSAKLIYRRHLGQRIAGIKPYKTATITHEQLVGQTLPLSEDISRTFMKHSAGRMNCAIGFDDNDGYCQIISTDNKTHHLAIAMPWAIKHHANRVSYLGQSAGTEKFITEQSAIMAHEMTHMKAPWWHRLANYEVMALAAIIAAPTAMALGYAGLMAVPAASACIQALGGAVAVFMCGQLAQRAEEYRADRGAVKHCGGAQPLAGIFPAEPTPLAHTFKRLFTAHPSFSQRAVAAKAYAEQLNPLERVNGAVRMALIHGELAARHAHMFKPKPPEANPAGVLRPARGARAPA